MNARAIVGQALRLPTFENGKRGACPTNHLFAALDVYHDVDSRSAALNMAIDEALLEIARVPSIRFYQWNHPVLSFGYFGRFEDVSCYNRDSVRRWTGGGIVFHGEDLTYSLVIPAGTPALEESSVSIYEKVHCAIQLMVGFQAKLEVGRDAALRRPRTSQRDVPTEECFANPVRADVLLNGRKIAGAAQRRTRRGLLQQGSIQGIDFENGFADRLARELCHECRKKEFDAALIARAQEVAEQKYGTSAWLRRR